MLEALGALRALLIMLGHRVLQMPERGRILDTSYRSTPMIAPTGWKIMRLGALMPFRPHAGSRPARGKAAPSEICRFLGGVSFALSLVDDDIILTGGLMPPIRRCPGHFYRCRQAPSLGTARRRSSSSCSATVLEVAGRYFRHDEGGCFISPGDESYLLYFQAVGGALRR